MTFINEAGWDRGLRMLVGLALLFAAWGAPSAIVGWVLVALAVVALVTAIVGWCPAYSLFRVSTKKIAG